jgi:aminoglycoside phosphotransferase (APT) family kinase protein
VHRDDIDSDLAARLVAAQFPQWAALPLTRVPLGGWDNRTFRLGDELSVRLPSAEAYAAQVAKEQRWLPRLARELPLPVPSPVGAGVPGEGYPWPWSVYRWLPGEPAETARVADATACAEALGGFLTALEQVDASDGPAAGVHNFHRGGDLRVYDTETRAALRALVGQVDTSAALEVWDSALASRWEAPPVWVHGDVSAANLLVEDGRLSAVIDFGSSGVGDPASDTVIAWTFLEGPARDTLRAAWQLDEDTWARGRGWALWKGLITLVGDPAHSGAARTVQRVLDEHRSLTHA